MMTMPMMLAVEALEIGKMRESGIYVRKTQVRMVLEGHRWRVGSWIVLRPTTVPIFRLVIRRRLKEQNAVLQIGRVSVVGYCRCVIVYQRNKFRTLSYGERERGGFQEDRPEE